jgi:hypothetical protein
MFKNVKSCLKWEKLVKMCDILENSNPNQFYTDQSNSGNINCNIV